MGPQLIWRILRAGAWTSGAFFCASLLLERLPVSLARSVAIDVLRKGGASLLLATPMVGLVGAGATLAVRGEYRYAIFAGGVLLLLGLALGAHFGG